MVMLVMTDIRCERCGVVHRKEAVGPGVVRAFEADGWKMQDGHDVCPECAAKAD